MMQTTSKAGIDFIKGFESFVPYVYDDLVRPVRGKYREWDGGEVKGTLTIGYGHTDDAKHPLKIRQGLRISEAEACDILAVDLADCEATVRSMLKVPVSQGQWDACISFTFNCGGGNFKNIARRINAGDMDGARAAFDLYTKSKGVPLRGLQRRRKGEQALWDAVDPPPIKKADTFHPAEVDPPAQDPLPLPQAKPVAGVSGEEATPGRLRFEAAISLARSSRKWLLLRWQKLIGVGTAGMGFVGLSPEDPVGVVREGKALMAELGVAGLIIVGLLVYIVASRTQTHMVDDKLQGRYRASGEDAHA